MTGERSAVITGIAQTAVGRRLGREPIDLTVEAARAAIADAGLERDDIDGLATFPGAVKVSPGFSGPATADVQDAMRLKTNWVAAGIDGSGPFTPFINACMAIAGGLAKHVLVYRTLTESSAQGISGRGGVGVGGGNTKGVDGFYRWLVPFHAYSAVNWLAMYAQRHMHEFGTERRHLGAIAINGRRMAGRNPAAIYREPLSLEEYLEARMISTPFGLYDCDVPCDGSTAFVLSHRQHVPASAAGIQVEALGSALHGRPSWDQWGDLTTMAMHDAAEHMWSRTDLRPADVDFAQLYDGFSFLALLWLEALGFCKPGEGGPFVEDGHRIALDGDLPLNTDGGQLSAGRLHGFGRVYEACLQLRGAAGARQVPGEPEIAIASAGGGPTGACMLLSRRGGS